MPARAMMGKQFTQDPTDVSDGVEALSEMSPRLHNASGQELHTCRCGALVVVPKGHTALDDDKEVLCHDCDKPLGLKLYEAFAR